MKSTPIITETIDKVRQWIKESQALTENINVRQKKSKTANAVTWPFFRSKTDSSPYFFKAINAWLEDFCHANKSMGNEAWNSI